VRTPRREKDSDLLRSFKQLKVWQKSYGVCLGVYRLTLEFPREERFGLAAQVRRSAASIPSNIAEGYARQTLRDYVRFLWIARGSLAELETQLMLCADLRYASHDRLEELLQDIAELQPMLLNLIRSLERKRRTELDGRETAAERGPTGPAASRHPTP
jgi:four helix bundle protein